MTPPTAIEINPIPECLDGKCAVKNFVGKSVEQATKLFEDNGLHYSDDLRWMGPIGFKFYFKAALAYLKSAKSHGDPDFLNSMISILESRLFGEYNDFEGIKGGIDDYAEFSSYALDNYDAYDLDQNIYGDLRPNLRSLSEKLQG
jgi:hypothetical protein